MAKGGYTYIVSSSRRTTLYIGVTSHLYHRIYQHKHGHGSSFTSQYNCTDLVYYEFFERIETAIDRENQLKKWKRSYKDNLIAAFNPEWRDLFKEIEDCQ